MCCIHRLRSPSDTNGYRRTQTERAFTQIESAQSGRSLSEEGQLILDWQQQACRAKSLQLLPLPTKEIPLSTGTTLSPRTEAIRFLIRSIRPIRIQRKSEPARAAVALSGMGEGCKRSTALDETTQTDTNGKSCLRESNPYNRALSREKKGN